MSRKKATHTSFRQGQRILITLNDGSKIDTKFFERRSKYIVTDAGDFNNSALRNVSIFRHQPQVER